MFGVVCKNHWHFARIPPVLELFALDKPSRLFPVRCISIDENKTNQQSFVVSYLVNSCGLSPKSAVLASKLVHFETPDKPDAVLSLFKNRGFSQTQISNIVKLCPRLLLSKHEKTIVPKLEFFHSQGLSSSDITQFLSSCPYVLHTSLKNHIVPYFKFLRDLIKSDEKFVKTLKRCYYIINCDLESELAHKIKFLRDNGVSESNISKLFQVNPQRMVYVKLDKFIEIVKEARNMGFNPSKPHFFEAVQVIMSMTTSTWERKVSVFKRWNWSEDEILTAFRMHPFIMSTSEDKVAAVMDLFVNQMGWDSSDVAKHPVLIKYSLEKRLIPRTSVLQFLISKGLVKKEFRNFKFFDCPELTFLQKFVNCYGETPELLKLYGEKLSLRK